MREQAKMEMSKKMKNRGQAVIESLVLLPLFLMLTSLPIYFSFQHLYLQWACWSHQEFAFCQWTERTPQQCLEVLKERIAFVHSAKLLSHSLSERSPYISVKTSVQTFSKVYMIQSQFKLKDI